MNLGLCSRRFLPILSGWKKGLGVKRFFEKLKCGSLEAFNWRFFHLYALLKLRDRCMTQSTAYTIEELLNLDVQEFSNLDLVRLAETPPHLLATFLERQTVDNRRVVLRLLSESQASEVLAEMDTEDTAETVGAMREWRAVKILEELDPDDAADVVSELDADDRDRLLGKLMPKTADTVRRLLSYDKDTAGGMMNPDAATIPMTATVDQAISHLRALKDKVEHVHYVYALGKERTLEGVVSIRDLLLAKPEQTVASIAQTSLQGLCRPWDDKEAVALLLADLNLLALPVVDAHNHFLGVITYDDVIDVIQAEATEDIQRLVGAGPDESVHHGIWFSMSRRSPWLLVNLTMSLCASCVISTFQHEIENFAFLAVFMSMIASLGGNTGSQTLAVSIRSLALGDFHLKDGRWVCLKEAFKGFLNGVMLGIVGGLVAWAWTRHFMLAVVIFISCILNMAVAGTVGAFIPLFLKRLHLDPAQGSSIFLTAITDMSGYFIFLTLGTWLILK
jgi:magnesium transporter